MPTRIAVGRARVVREVRAAEPLAERLRAPLTARPPWLTAVLVVQAARRLPGRPVAVVVGGDLDAAPRAAAFLWLRRRGLGTAVTLLGDGVGPVPGGRPHARLLAADDDAAAFLADGIADLLGTLRGTWSLRLAGLPLGDPTARRLAARFRGGALATARTGRLVDELGDEGVARSRDPRELERWLPALLARVPDARSRTFVRSAARVHAAAGRLELAVTQDAGGELRDGLLTLVDGEDRWAWWSTAALAVEMGAPAATLTVPPRRLLPAPDAMRWLRVSGRGAGR
ncbi:hypothetical protein [Blastococcus sp. TF02A-30]|uniref:hypothetical protein n=1 Tax=Blastococcus sp. TF02A-30 TaxID=2250580 RepID=UPI0018F315B8|nr:hypothetical protein [Blastococcus sp. TF02A-30]